MICLSLSWPMSFSVLFSPSVLTRRSSARTSRRGSGSWPRSTYHMWRERDLLIRTMLSEVDLFLAWSSVFVCPILSLPPAHYFTLRWKEWQLIFQVLRYSPDICTMPFTWESADSRTGLFTATLRGAVITVFHLNQEKTRCSMLLWRHLSLGKAFIFFR